MGQLTENQRKIIEGHLAAVGDQFHDVVVEAIISFLDEPGVKDVFPWADPAKSSGEHRELPGFKSHVKAIASYMQECLGHLDAIDTQKDKLQSLGAKHESRKVTTEMYQKLGKYVVKNVHSKVGDAWNQECGDAWVAAYELMVCNMVAK